MGNGSTRPGDALADRLRDKFRANQARREGALAAAKAQPRAEMPTHPELHAHVHVAPERPKSEPPDSSVRHFKDALRGRFGPIVQVIAFVGGVGGFGFAALRPDQDRSTEYYREIVKPQLEHHDADLIRLWQYVLASERYDRGQGKALGIDVAEAPGASPAASVVVETTRAKPGTVSPAVRPAGRPQAPPEPLAVRVLTPPPTPPPAPAPAKLPAELPAK